MTPNQKKDFRISRRKVLLRADSVVLCVSVVNLAKRIVPTEAQRSHRDSRRLFSAVRFAGSLCITLLFIFSVTASQLEAQSAKSQEQTASRARIAGEPKSPDSHTSLPAIHSRAEFDSLAVTYDADTPYALPHVLFVIDRQNRNRIYYVNTNLYKFHKDFVNGTYLSLERGQVFFENNYLKPNRRFIMGTIAYQTPVRKWTFEFWEGDLIPSEQIRLAADIINQSFFTPVAFKPNSTRQDEASARIEGLQRVLQTEISRNQEYEPLNVAKALGRIHVIPKLDEHVEIGFNEILVLDEGSIRERGTHEQLLRSGGLYQQMVQLQEGILSLT